MIPMQINSDDVKLLCGTEDIDAMAKAKTLHPFDSCVCEFLSELSAAIFTDRDAKRYPDVVTFGFFCRSANLKKLSEPYLEECGRRLGRGLSFHIAPSNVPVNFAYSLAAGLLSGCACVVRVSAKHFEQTDIICRHIAALLEQERFSSMRERIAIVQYGRSENVNSYFSARAGVRVIWGGDRTIAEIRRSLLPPRGKEIDFADRYSIAVIDAEYYLEKCDRARTALDFYNDTYLFDQNACTSPQLIYWLGDRETAEKASGAFWAELHKLLPGKYTMPETASVDKLMTACRLAADMHAEVVPMPDQLISVIRVGELSAELPEYRCACGSFIEYSGTELAPLADIINEKYQTIAYIGDIQNKLTGFVAENGLSGADRIVPVGRTMDFSLIWDGYDLIREMSRIIASIGEK